MKPTVISKEYLALQTEISNKQLVWAKAIESSPVVEKQSLHHKQVPVIAQVAVSIDETQYVTWLLELADFLVEKNETLRESITILKEHVNEEVAKRWSNEVLAFNELYFANFAKEKGIAEWLPYFLAEHSLRPYLRVIANSYTDELASLDTKSSCPCCGEPIHLAVLEGKGKKMIVCPRCEAKWSQNRLHCVHCGNDDHKQLRYFTVEGDQSSRIEVCDECNSYMKVLDTRKMFKKQSAFILDVTSLHLDFVAQEQGFGEKKQDEIKS